MNTLPGRDIPGYNTELRPEYAPRWLQWLESKPSPAMPVQQKGIDKTSAVLVLFSGLQDSAALPHDAAVLLTHRSPTMRSHSGQIAFPGGRCDPEDKNLVDCALREAWEETGLDRRSVTVIAQREQVNIRATGYPVHPIIGYQHHLSPVSVVNPIEADEVFWVPLTQLLAPENRLTVGYGGWKGPAFMINGYLVWGFTAGILAALFDESGWVKPWNYNTVHDLNTLLASSRNGERIS